METKLNAQANVAAGWYTENILLANKHKFQTLTLNSNKKESAAITIKIDETTIEPTNLMRLLGINIDNKLNLSEHLKIVTVKNRKPGWCPDVPQQSHTRKSQTTAV